MPSGFILNIALCIRNKALDQVGMVYILASTIVNFLCARTVQSLFFCLTDSKLFMLQLIKDLTTSASTEVCYSLSFELMRANHGTCLQCIQMLGSCSSHCCSCNCEPYRILVSVIFHHLCEMQLLPTRESRGTYFNVCCCVHYIQECD